MHSRGSRGGDDIQGGREVGVVRTNHGDVEASLIGHLDERNCQRHWSDPRHCKQDGSLREVVLPLPAIWTPTTAPDFRYRWSVARHHHRIPRIAALTLVLVGCSGDSAAPSSIALPPANAPLDYQLGVAYSPDPDVAVLARDRTAVPDADRYNICYVNGFQSQPDEASLWLDEHPDLVLRDDNGEPLVDPEWPDEYIFDISTPGNRAQLAEIVGAWIDGCATSGFQAVEIDNLDSYARFADRLTEDQAVDFARQLTKRAHANGLAIGQKNAAEILPRRSEAGFDFAVVEQCNEFDECGQFTDAYGDQVYAIEYTQANFDKGCAEFPQISIVLRDRDVSAPGSATYVRQTC